MKNSSFESHSLSLRTKASLKIFSGRTFFLSAVLALSHFSHVLNICEAANASGPPNSVKSTLNTLRLTAFRAIEKRDFLNAIYIAKRCVNLQSDDSLSRRYLCVALLSNGDIAQSIDQFKLWTDFNKNVLDDQISFVRLVRSNETDPSPFTTQCLDILVDKNLGNAANLIDISNACVQMRVTSGPVLKALKYATSAAKPEQLRTILDIRKSLYDQVTAAMEKVKQH